VTKGELEVIRERYALAEKTLWKAGLPVPTMPQRERPVAKGPAAAPATNAHAAQQAPENADSQTTPPRPEATPAELPSGGVEPISAAAAQLPAEGPALRNGSEGEGEPAHN